MTNVTSRLIGVGTYTTACKNSSYCKGCKKMAVVELFAWAVCPKDGVSVGLITPHATVRGQEANPLIAMLDGVFP
jgi:hypothetical protein